MMYAYSDKSKNIKHCKFPSNEDLIVLWITICTYFYWIGQYTIDDSENKSLAFKCVIIDPVQAPSTMVTK